MLMSTNQHLTLVQRTIFEQSACWMLFRRQFPFHLVLVYYFLLVEILLWRLPTLWFRRITNLFFCLMSLEELTVPLSLSIHLESFYHFDVFFIKCS